jgi:Sec-independent protein translocase protein TatA
MRSLGQGVVEFKKGVQGIEDAADEPAKTREARQDEPQKTS